MWCRFWKLLSTHGSPASDAAISEPRSRCREVDGLTAHAVAAQQPGQAGAALGLRGCSDAEVSLWTRLVIAPLLLDQPIVLGRRVAEETSEALGERLGDRWGALERAEARLAAGTYGASILSGRPIPDERLEAFPLAELTVQEAAQRDRSLGERREPESRMGPSRDPFPGVRRPGSPRRWAGRGRGER